MLTLYCNAYCNAKPNLNFPEVHGGQSGGVRGAQEAARGTLGFVPLTFTCRTMVCTQSGVRQGLVTIRVS